MNKNKQEFVHFRNYSQYSLAKGALKLTELVKFCHKNKFPAVSISDFSNLFGALEFSIECQKYGIQPLIGCNLLIKNNKLINGYVLLICKNKQGYENLLNLVSKSYLINSDSENPYVKIDDLNNHSEGLICMAGGNFGLLTNNYYHNKELVIPLVNHLIKIYKSNFCIEIQRYLNEKSENYNQFLIETSLKGNIPIICTNENFFMQSDFYDSHDTLLCISQQKYIDSEDRMKSSKEFYVKSSKEMYSLFNDIPMVCENTLVLAQKCSFFPTEKKPSLPRLINKDITENHFLIKSAFKGLKVRIKNLKGFEKNIYIDRLKYELKIITNMGFSGYFLIVADFIKWSKDNDIPVGPGRGSGAGSLVAWCLSITNLDPLKFGLLFERFLNPERISMPDFDIDFCMQGRDKVINYVQKKYGFQNVAQIITFGSFQAKAALRDVGRVMQLPLSQVDEICKMIPFNPAKPVTISDFLEENEKIKKIIKNNKNIKTLFNHAKNLEGLLRHASTHAAGIVISDKKLNNIVPLYKDPKSDIPVTQFSMKYVEKAGLIKFDFLGLKTLTVINDTCKILKSKSIDIDINKVALDDVKTFKLLREGHTTGVFQLEGQGMRETIMRVLPDRFEDLIAIVSLYRPGPMDNIPTYVNRKHNNVKNNYIHKDLKEILDETYGIMVYQEQVMLIAQKLSGFSLAKADLLRRAMGKKIKSEMHAQKSNFITGCLKNNIDENQANNLFNEIEKFAGYGFNKSHAAAYAMIAYQTAYLKANHPLEFFCSLMNCDINNAEKLSIYCDEIRKLGFRIVRPDINNSEVEFTVLNSDENDSIIFGLSAIKNIGESSIREIIKERSINGKFENFSDFLIRVSNNFLNKKVLEALIFSDSLKSIERNQKFLYDKIDEMVSINSNYHKNLNINQDSLFSDDKLFEIQVNSDGYDFWDKEFKLEKEIEVIGFYLSEHPTKNLKKVFQDVKINNISDLSKPENKLLENSSFIAVVNEINERKSKQGKRFCFINLADDTSKIDAVCFSDVLDVLDFDLKKGKVYKFIISSQYKNENQRFIINNIRDIYGRNNNNDDYLVKLDLEDLDTNKIKTIFKECDTGKNKLSFILKYNDFEILIESKKKYDLGFNFLNSVSEIKGLIINKVYKN